MAKEDLLLCIRNTNIAVRDSKPAMKYRILVLPKNGIRINPARKVPMMLPIVDIAYRLPTVFPVA